MSTDDGGGNTPGRPGGGPIGSPPPQEGMGPQHPVALAVQRGHQRSPSSDFIHPTQQVQHRDVGECEGWV